MSRKREREGETVFGKVPEDEENIKNIIAISTIQAINE